MDTEEVLTPERVRELLIESLALHTKLQANLLILDRYSIAKGRPDWWRQRQKDTSQAIWMCADLIDRARPYIAESLSELEAWLASGKPD